MSLATSTLNNNLQVFEFFARCLRWIAATTYVLTVILLMFYFVKYYYHRCILIPEVHHVRILPHRCRKYRKLEDLFDFYHCPVCFKKSMKNFKIYYWVRRKKRFERYAFLSYFYFCVLLVFFAVDIYFEVYWDPEWHEVMFYYYLPEMDVYFTGFDTLSMEYFGLD